MDVKPQRPLRALRIRDENIPPQGLPGKAIHQRNKSTPVLSTMVQQGGIKAAPKRTAFADVSNLRALQSRDDAAIVSKRTQDAMKELPLVPTQDIVLKAPVLARPAQRTLSSAIVKALSHPASTATAPSVAQKHNAEERGINDANPKKLISKHATAVYKEAVTVVDNLPVPVAKETRSTASIAHAHHIAPAGREDARVHKSADADAPSKAPVRSEPKPRDAVVVASKRSSLVEKFEQTFLRRSSSSSTQVSIESVSDNQDGAEVGSRDTQEYVDALEQRAKDVEREQELERERIEEYAHQSNITNGDEPEEYWDEEDEDDYYDDGYTTTRSFRSRGDNTTGGPTIVLAPRVTAKTQRELEAAKQHVEANKTQEDIEDELWDTSMVAEYGDEIFEYMRSLEERMRPNPFYMDHQTEIQWSMRSVLMDWLVQVHHRFNLLPETLFLSVNYVDRFLSTKIVSIGKLQLVGATAIFVAAKYEEINCPSVQEIVYMVDGGYTMEEILKAERFMLTMLQFELGWPGPMSFLRRISKADDYDLETRTLAKYFLEVAIMDERFVGCQPSFIAAGAHCLSRFMLKKGDWTPAHVHYSNYTYSQIRHLVATILECCEEPRKHHGAVFDKYADKRYKRASLFVEKEIQRGFQLPPYGRESTPSYSQSWRRK